MAQENMQKIKLLKLLEMLHNETDEQHPMTTLQIITKLGDMGISCDRRTLTRDVALLNEQGYEIMSLMQGHNKAYYVDDRSFSIPELKILMDAVQAASFITEKKTQRLIERIAALGGSHQGELLCGNVITFNTTKHSNESIFYVVDALSSALEQRRRVSFSYYHLNENREKCYHHNGERYDEEPIALIYNEDNYYLLCYNPGGTEGDMTRTYRVDRIEQVELGDPISEEALALQKEQPAAYTAQTFKMFNGPAVNVTLEFDDDLINVIFDKFGEQVQMVRTGEHRCVAALDVRISPTFWGWLFQFAGKMRLLSPMDLSEEYVRRARLVCDRS